MQIGKPGEPVTRISHASPDRIEVRGRDLTGDLMGRLSFTEYFHLLLTGREPNDDERFFLELAHARGVSGPHVALARALQEAVAETWGKPLTLNVSLPIAAVMLDLGYSPAIVKAVPILARTASLLAHLAEEQEQPIGFLLAAKAEEAVEYRDD